MSQIRRGTPCPNAPPPRIRPVSNRRHRTPFSGTGTPACALLPQL